MSTRADFHGGGYVVHRICLHPSPCRFSAWFDAAGALVDAERIDAMQRSGPVSPAQRAVIARIYGKA